MSDAPDYSGGLSLLVGVVGGAAVVGYLGYPADGVIFTTAVAGLIGVGSVFLYERWV